VSSSGLAGPLLPAGPRLPAGASDCRRCRDRCANMRVPHIDLATRGLTQPSPSVTHPPAARLAAQS